MPGGEGSAGTEEAREGADTLEDEADEAGVLFGGEGSGVGAGRGSGEDHAEEAAQSEADPGVLGIEAGVAGEGGEVLGLEGGGIEAVDQAIVVGREHPTPALPPCGRH